MPIRLTLVLPVLTLTMLGNATGAKAELLSCNTNKDTYDFDIKEGIFRSSVELIVEDEVIPFSDVEINHSIVKAKFNDKSGTISLIINRVTGLIKMTSDSSSENEVGTCRIGTRKF